MSETRDRGLVSKRLLLILGVAIGIAALNLAWTFYSRWNANQEALRAKEGQEEADARRTLELLGQFKILSFYAMPMAIRPGEHSNMCYGVSETKAVRIAPDVEPVKPALSRCFPVSPKKTTEYTLTAEDGKGHTLSESFVLRVR